MCWLEHRGRTKRLVIALHTAFSLCTFYTIQCKIVPHLSKSLCGALPGEGFVQHSAYAWSHSRVQRGCGTIHTFSIFAVLMCPTVYGTTEDVTVYDEGIGKFAVPVLPELDPSPCST